jgi:hypothetical protein
MTHYEPNKYSNRLNLVTNNDGNLLLIRHHSELMSSFLHNKLCKFSLQVQNIGAIYTVSITA